MLWKQLQLQLSTLAERYVAFSLPQNNLLLMIAYDSIHVIDVSSGHIQSDYVFSGDEYITSDNHSQFVYRNKQYEVIGLFGGKEIRQSDKNEILEICEQSRSFQIINEHSQIDFQFNFDDLSGDWHILSFSHDFNHCILGLPYNLYIFKRTISDEIVNNS